MSVLAVIPARGGSKGIPAKNMVKLGGMTLVERAIKIALSMGYRAVVSTDHKDIASHAADCGAAVKRISDGGYLHSDKCRSIDVWRDAWSLLPNYRVSVLLEPTCPFRVPDDIERCLELMDKYTSVATVSCAIPLQKLFVLEGNKIITKGFIPRRQDCPQYYKVNGACYAMRRDHIGQIIDEARAVVIDRPLVNIDTLEDLEYAKYLYPRTQIYQPQPGQSASVEQL